MVRNLLQRRQHRRWFHVLLLHEQGAVHDNNARHRRKLRREPILPCTIDTAAAPFGGEATPAPARLRGLLPRMATALPAPLEITHGHKLQVCNPPLAVAAYADRPPQRPGVDQNRNDSLSHADQSKHQKLSVVEDSESLYIGCPKRLTSAATSPRSRCKCRTSASSRADSGLSPDSFRA
jgi:hypothetical protein